jgi:hypothetical protein
MVLGWSPCNGNEYFNIYSRFVREIFHSADLYLFLQIRDIIIRCHIKNHSTNLNPIWLGWALVGSLSKLCLTGLPCIQDGSRY